MVDRTSPANTDADGHHEGLIPSSDHSGSFHHHHPSEEQSSHQNAEDEQTKARDEVQQFVNSSSFADKKKAPMTMKPWGPINLFSLAESADFFFSQ
jgi:hypothetical protein